MEDLGSWFKSIDTKGRISRPRIPFIGPSAAALNASVIASIDIGWTVLNLKSVQLTFGVGTRIATQFNLPLSSGKTNPTASAAPVFVGIIESAAARPCS